MIKILRVGPTTRIRLKQMHSYMEMEGSEENGSAHTKEEIQIFEDERGYEYDMIYNTDGVLPHVSGMMFKLDEKR